MTASLLAVADRLAGAGQATAGPCLLVLVTDLERQGVLSLDAFPENMTAPLINRYLEIKARHLL